MSNAALDYLLAQEWSMGNGQCPDCHGMGPFMQSFHPRWTDVHGHRDGCKLASAIAALSHAAGQDGEQCRAASGFLRIVEEMESACCSYAGPDVDYTVDASTVYRWAEALRALSRGVPDGMVLAPVEPTPEMIASCPGGLLAPACVAAYKTMISAAIAAQRKEG